VECRDSLLEKGILLNSKPITASKRRPWCSKDTTTSWKQAFT